MQEGGTIGQDPVAALKGFLVDLGTRGRNMGALHRVTL